MVAEHVGAVMIAVRVYESVFTRNSRKGGEKDEANDDSDGEPSYTEKMRIGKTGGTVCYGSQFQVGNANGPNSS